MAAVALERPLGDPVIEILIRGIWVIYGLAVGALLSVSIGQLLLARRFERRQMRALSISVSSTEIRELQEFLAKLCRDAGLGRVNLVITTTRQLSASAMVFGVWPPDRFVVVSSDCMDILERAELEALLAHELAHHVEGHCRLMQLMRWLGRMTFVGDGFVLALQDSWGYERFADRTTVHKMGIDKGALRRCLLRLRYARELSELARGSRKMMTDDLPAGLPIVDDRPTSKEDDRESKPQWWKAWECFRNQYFHAMEFHYWHPDTRQRARYMLRASDGGDG